VVGDELRIYFTGFSGISPKNGTRPYAGSSTGLATLRRDGFVSMNGPGEAMRTVEPRIRGTLTTRTVTFSGRRLFVNAKVKVGALRAEVLDPAGRPIEPFTLANCVPVTSDPTKQPVVWKHGGDLRGLAGKPVRLRFEMTSGELYSYWVSRDESGASRGYVAAGGPGFTGSTDTTGA
jgi:hypothetical protein